MLSMIHIEIANTLITAVWARMNLDI